MHQLLSLTAVLWLLSACSSLPETAPVSSWEEHRSRVQQLESWELSGRLNIRSGNRSDTINLLWVQDNDSFEISLNGPLGLGSVLIHGTDDGVLVEKSGEQALYADSLALISSTYLGYEFPADGLYYWIRGISAPDTGNSIVLNDQQLLERLTQDEWQLLYDRYQNINGINLPGRIRMAHAPYRLTFLISRWEFE